MQHSISKVNIMKQACDTCILCSFNREAEQPKNQQVICNPITLLYGKSTCIITLHV